MIVGIGIDIIEVARVERLLASYGERFINRVFTDVEVAYSTQMAYPAMHFAARFAAKEAFMKALGTGLSGGIRWRDVSVFNDDIGRPWVKFCGNAEKNAKKIGIDKAHISISHTKKYATAVVILERI